MSGTAVGDEVFFQRIGLAGAVETIALRQEEDYTERAEINEKLGRDDITPDEREELRARARGLEREFISMVDVTILGAGPVALKVPAWRGRLSQISGWVLGSLDEPE